MATRQALTKRIQTIRRHGANQAGANPQLQQRIAKLRTRRSKLSVPKVNANPQPPGSSMSAAAASSTPQITQNFPPRTPTTKPVSAAPTAPSAPSAPSAPTSPDPFNPTAISSFHGANDPRDATYWSNLNKLVFNANQDYASNLADELSANVDYSRTMEGLNTNFGRDQRSLAENAIRSNLSASGWLDRSATEQTQDFSTNVEGVNLSKSQEDAARIAARNAISQGLSIDEAALLAEAAANYAQGQADVAANAIPDYAPDAGGTVSAASRPTPKPPGFSNWSKTRKQHWLANHR